MGFKAKMYDMITGQGDDLHVLEKNGEIELWIVYDHESKGDPFGRAPLYQLWNADKRVFVGANRRLAYEEYASEVLKDEEDY